MVCEITRQNFKDLYPKIEHAINSADFISIDTEFTGLCIDDDWKPSLFDSSIERYHKLRRSVGQFTLCQLGYYFIRKHAPSERKCEVKNLVEELSLLTSFPNLSSGLTTFAGNVQDNSYKTDTYTFYLCPMSFGSCDQSFSVRASALQFLCKHKFNFNKWFYEGLPCLNQEQEKVLEEELESGLLFAGIERDVDEREVQSLCSLVAAWLPKSNVGECLTLSLAEESSPIVYIFHKDLRTRFPQIWTTTNAFGQVVVERVDHVKREILEKQSQQSDKQQEKEQLQEMLGFTRVFRLIQAARKPVVGHNMLMDLMFVYDKFYQPLPDNYKAFKDGILKIFPAIFDTKHINYCLRKPLESLELFKASSLHELFDAVISQRVMTLTLLQPRIITAKSDLRPEAEHPHNAGYDSFMCGCVFLRLCHLLHCRNISSMDVQPCHFKSYLPTMRAYRNCVNVIRAMVSHIKLDGNEPLSQRPPLIHVQAIKPGGKLVAQQLAVWFSLYGAVDIHMINSRQAVVATSNFMTARDIICAFQDHSAISVTKYRFWEHSRLGQGILLGSLVVATGACALLLISAFR